MFKQPISTGWRAWHTLFVVLLAVHLLDQLGIAFLDVLLQIAIGVLQCFNRGSRVRTAAHVGALDLGVKVGRRLEALLGAGRGDLEFDEGRMERGCSFDRVPRGWWDQRS